MKRTLQEWHNEFTDHHIKSSNYGIEMAIESLKYVIKNANHAYYEGGLLLECKLSDAEYDTICKQYVALNKMIGREVDSVCSFIRFDKKTQQNT